MFRPVSVIPKIFFFYIQKFPDHKGKLRITNFLLEFYFNNGIIVEGYNGTLLKLEHNDWISRNIIYHKSYEPCSIAASIDMLKNGGVFLDIGANFGLYSCILGRLKNVEAFAIEPGAESFTRLVNNIKLNDDINIKIFHFGLADKNDIFNFKIDWFFNLGAAQISSYENSKYKAFDTGFDYSVLCVTLDSLLDKINKPIELMKMDVEGFELKVLEGLSSSHKFKPKNIIMEFKETGLSNDRTICKESLISRIRDLGYEIFDVTGAKIDNFCSIIEHNIWLKLQQL